MKRFLVGLIALSCLFGCGTIESTAPADNSITGTWDLRSINGINLPFVYQMSSTTAHSITTRVLTISDDGTYREITTITMDGESATATDQTTEVGTWTALNGFITFNDETDKLTYTASVTGNTLTENYAEFTSVYSRR